MIVIVSHFMGIYVGTQPTHHKGSISETNTGEGYWRYEQKNNAY